MSDYNSDFLIVGSGIAGLSAAARLSKIGTVSLLSKKNIAESNTLYAQGGIAAAMGSGDTVELHIKDTLFAGAGLCETAAVEEIISKGPACIQELLALGAKFSDQESGPDLGLEGGHRKRRIFHSGDSTGEEIEKTLLHSLPKRAAVFENHTAIDLILKYPARDTFAPNNACYGVYALDEKNGEVKSFTAKFTVLASGGAGKVYRYTSNPDVATGDGMAMAFRAGVALKNMEFVQFHPTCLYHREVKSFLISEALRGEGGILRLSDGTDFM
ncbi:MAG: FAD-binding protein, partial [Elusimicrobia bacterium]|nr:FAD-binding protein [Elusimicrobiota bacterium]